MSPSVAIHIFCDLPPQKRKRRFPRSEGGNRAHTLLQAFVNTQRKAEVGRKGYLRIVAVVGGGAKLVLPRLGYYVSLTTLTSSYYSPSGPWYQARPLPLPLLLPLALLLVMLSKHHQFQPW